MISFAHFEQSIKECTGRIWVAYSGGRDSHVLLHSLLNLTDADTHTCINAIHIDHGLHPDSKRWAAHCRDVCKLLKVSLIVKTIQIARGQGESLEAAARTARYQAICKMLAEGDVLLTAHHQDDQAETLLLQLLRGCGVKGLAAMPEKAALGKGIHYRPFLHIPAKTIKIYAEKNHLTWIDDPSNAQHHFARNYLRQQVMPLLMERWNNAAALISRSAKHCATSQELLDEIAAQDLLTMQGSIANALSISRLLNLSTARRMNAIRYFIHRRGLPLPSDAQLQHIVQDVLSAAPNTNPLVRWGNCAARRYRDDFYILQQDAIHLKELVKEWDGKLPIKTAVGTLLGEVKIGKGIQRGLPMTVCFRSGGERCHMQGKPGHHPLKKLFQEWGVAPWLRDRIPLIKVKGEIAAVVGYGVCAPFAVAAHENGLTFSLATEDNKLLKK